jgi:hypothetical protein
MCEISWFDVALARTGTERWQELSKSGFRIATRSKQVFTANCKTLEHFRKNLTSST